MTGPVGNATVGNSVNYKSIPNNTNPKWWRDAGLRKNVYYCIGLCGTFFFGGYDSSLFNSLQTIDAWQEFFGHPKGNILGLMNSAALFPGLVTPYFAERIANRWGRRWAVWIGIWVNMIGVIVNSAAINMSMYITGRVIMGIGISMGLTIAPTLLQEFAHPRYRAPLGTIYTCVHYLAAIVSASICLATRNICGDASWRIPCYFQLFGPIVTFVVVSSIPESPRWLIRQGRRGAALSILAEYHANGTHDDPLVIMEFNEIVEGIEAEQEDSQVAYADFLKPANHRRLFLLVIIAIGTNWLGNGLLSYYLRTILEQIGVKSTFEQSSLNLGLQVWNLIISSAAGLNCDRIGRQPLWLTSVIGMFFMFAVVMGLSASYDNERNPAVGLAVIPFLFFFFGFYDIAWTPLANMYTVEILPYHIRTKGQAIYNIVQGSANAINQWVNPIILDAIAWRYYAVYLVILSVYIVIIYFNFPETKNLTIEEISGVFDGNHAAGIRAVSTSVHDHDGGSASAISRGVLVRRRSTEETAHLLEHV